MRFLSWLKRRGERQAAAGGTVTFGSIGELEAYLLGIDAFLAKSGQHVNYNTALRAATALACTRVVANDLAKLPLKLHQLEKNMRSQATGHPMFDLLYVEPNEFQTAYEFIHQLAVHHMLCGNSFVWKNRPIASRPIQELLPIEPQFVTVERRGWAVRYRVSTDDGQSFDVDPKDMWHIKNMSWDGYLGLDGTKLAREAIGLAMAAEEHGAKLFDNGATLSGAITTDKVLTDDARELLRQSFMNRHGGSGRSFGVAILPPGTKYEKIGQTNDEVQLLETRKFQVEEQCRAMDVLPIMVGHSDKTATYASAEAMFQAHLTKTMHPKFRLFEVSANKHLLTPEERRAGFYFKFAINALMYATAKDRAEYLKAHFDMASISPNEIRALDELNPYPGGDVYFCPMNMQAVGGADAPDPQGDGGTENEPGPLFPRH